MNQSIQVASSALYFHEVADDHLYVTDLIIGSAVQSVLQGASIRRAKALQNCFGVTAGASSMFLLHDDSGKKSGPDTILGMVKGST